MSNNSPSITERPVREENSQQLSILLQKAIGVESAPNFTEQQVDELLSQRREIAGYVQADKKRDSMDSKIYFIGILVFILIFSGFILYKDPNMFPSVLSFLAGLFGGGVGGYGWAKSKV